MSTEMKRNVWIIYSSIESIRFIYASPSPEHQRDGRDASFKMDVGLEEETSLVTDSFINNMLENRSL